MESLRSRFLDWCRYAPAPVLWATGVGLLVAASGAGWALWPGKASEAELLATVRMRLEQMDYIAAGIDARNLLQSNPSSGQARLVFAKALLGTGDVVGAQEELRRAASLGVDEQELLPTQAAALLALGQHQAVIARFKDATPASDAVAAELSVHVAQALVDSGDMAAAKIVVEEALKRVPEHIDATILQARLAAAGGQVELAVQQATALIQRHPQHAAAWQLQGELLSVGPDKVAEAAAALRKAIDLQPRLRNAHAKLIVLLLRQGDGPGAKAAAAAMGKSVPNSSQTLYLQALVAYVQGDYTLARERLQSLQLGESPRLLALAGTVESRLGNLVQADALLSKALQLKPDDERPRRELAAVHLLRGQPERALATLDKLLSRDGNNAEAWRIAGQAYSRQGDYTRADLAFKQVKRLQPTDKTIAIDVGRTLLARGQLEAGLRELEGAAKADDQGVSAELELVAAHMVRKDHAAALAAVESIARKMPSSSLPDLMKGQILLDSGNRREARAALDKAIGKDPASFAAVRSLAELDLAELKPEDAKRRYAALLERDPKSPRAMLALAGLVRQTAGNNQEALEWIDKAIQVNPLDVATWQSAIGFHRESGDTANTLSRARSAVAALPDNPELLALLADAQLAEGDTLQAIGNLSRLLELRPGSHEVHLLLAEAYVMAKQPDRALAAAERARELAPESTNAIRTSVRTALLAQRSARATQIAQDLQKSKPNLPMGWQLEGEIAMVERRFGPAAAAFRTALSKAPTSEGAWALYAAQMAAGKLADARQHSEAWLSQHPDDVSFLKRMAESAQDRGDLSEAELRFRQALKVQPDSPILMNNLAYLLVLRKDQTALHLALAAAKAAPYSPPVMDTVAHAYWSSGDNKKALEWQSKAVALSPKTLPYRIQLIRLHLLVGEKKDAREELDRVQSQLGSTPLPPEVKKLAAQAQD